MSNPKFVRPEHYGQVSQYQRVPLFDKNSTLDHTFTRDVFDRREEEVSEAATKSGFVLASKGRHYVCFKKLQRVA